MSWERKEAEEKPVSGEGARSRTCAEGARGGTKSSVRYRHAT